MAIRKPVFYIYGSTTSHREILLKPLEAIFGGIFQPHDSYFWGCYDKLTNCLEEEVNVKDNKWTDEDVEVIYPEYRQYPTIVEINDTYRGDELLLRLSTLGLQVLSKGKV